MVENEEELTNISVDIKNNFDYLLKTLSKLRSALHAAYTKDVPVVPTSADYKQALSSVSRASVLHTISKNS